MYDVIIIGGGASGFFAANLLIEQNPKTKLLILEKTGKTLQKVKISGGGRCNVTHNEPNQTSFSKHYPRGQKFLKKSLRLFGQAEMIQWLNNNGVDLKTEDDNRMFPQSNSSQTIIDCFNKVLSHRNCELKLNQAITDFTENDHGVDITTKQGSFKTRKLILAAGSSKEVWNLLQSKSIAVTPPVPSLFTFKFKKHPLVDLAGISLPNAQVKIAGTKLQYTGPWLITHHGISGPAVLKLSAFGARVLAEKQYQFSVMINFTGLDKWDNVSMDLQEAMSSQKLISNQTLFDIPKRLWLYFITKCEIPENKKWSELSKKELNKLTEELFQGTYEVSGKNTFKDEFVTAGGIELHEIEQETCRIKKLKHTYSIGEFLNIDGITGGFNFQSCWTTAFLAAKAINMRD